MFKGAIMIIEPMAIIMGLWSLLLTIFMGGLSWMINRVFKLLDDLRKEDDLIKADIAKSNENTSKRYVRRDDHLNFQNQILDFLRRIEDKIDKKADKKAAH